MQPIRDSKKSQHELPPPIEWHGGAFPPSAKCSHYGTRVTESMKILIKGKVDAVSLDRVKPAHLE